MTKIDNLDILKLLPYFMQEDEEVRLIMKVIQEELDLINARERNLFVYGDFQSLNEAVLDELAYQWRTEGYEQTLPRNVKARLVETSYIVRKTKGTSYAVEKTVQDIHGDFELLEWWQSNMEPYHFKIVGTSSPPGDKLAEIYKAIEITKNERSHLEGIIVSNQWEGTNYHGITTHLSLFEEIPFSSESISKVEEYIGGLNG